MRSKKWVDMLAMLSMISAIVTGFMLHNEIHHLHVYNDMALWTVHIVSGLIVTAAVVMHCIQHGFWFKNYGKIPVSRKGVTTLLFCVAIAVVISGILLALGSHSNFVSIFHYITSILFVVLAIFHIVRRWKIFTILFR